MATELMKKMIVAIAEDELAPGNGSRPLNANDATTWTNMVVYDSSDKGVLTNLIKEGLVWQDGKGKDSVVCLTQSGFDLYNEIRG